MKDIVKVSGAYISEVPHDLEVDAATMESIGANYGDIVMMKGIGFTELNVPFQIPESQRWRLVPKKQ